MTLQRSVPMGFSTSTALAIVAAFLAPSRAPADCPDCYGFVALDAEGEAAVVVARDAVSAAAGDLFGDGGEEWVAALEGGGVVVRSGDGAQLEVIPTPQGRALAIGGGRLFVALDGGILELDLAANASRFVSAVAAVALSAGDLDGDGASELAAALEDGGVLVLDLEDGAEFPLGGFSAIALAAGDFLGLGHDQLAVLLSGGGVEIVDLTGEDGARCFLGDLGSTTGNEGDAPRGFSALPSGAILTLDDDGEFLALDPRTCAVLAVDLSVLEVTHEPVFTSFRPAANVPSGGQVPGDCNEDGGLDISDAVCLLSYLFLGAPARLPCGDGSANDEANITLLEANGDGGIDLSDSVYLLSFLFLGGTPPVAGTECRVIPGCPERCVQ